MSEHKHYVPILKAKRGELWALNNASQSTRRMITPLLELAPVAKKKKKPTKTLGVHLADQLRHVAAALSSGHWRVFIDPRWLYHSYGARAAEVAFDAARKQFLNAVPVFEPGDDSSTIDAVKAVAGTDRRGALMRIDRQDLNHPQRILEALHSVGLKPKDADLLLDYRTSPIALSDDLPRVPDLEKWRTVCAASGIFPGSLSDYEDGDWHKITRNCWLDWRKAVTGKLPRCPAFSDYAIRAPGSPASGGDPPVAMRYTASTYWLVRLGGRQMAGESPKMRKICADLVERPEYSTKEFSAGDEQIYLVAKKTGHPTGGPTEWVKWSTSHHLAFVERQMAELP